MPADRQGFNYQISSWVFGVEVDGSWTNANDTVSIRSLIPGVSARTLNEVNWFATATGRLGFAANNFLLYVKGGGAWMDVDYTASGVTGAGTVVLGPATISDTPHGLDRWRRYRSRLLGQLVGEGRVQLHGLRQRSATRSPLRARP